MNATPVAPASKTRENTRSTLTEDHVQFFRDNGYLVVENAFCHEEIEELRRETVAICRGQRGEVDGLPAFDPNESDDEIQRRVLCIHFPHKISEPMRSSISHPAMVKVLTRIIGPNVKCMQSMLFLKAAGKPGQAWHQDEYYIPTRDRSLTGGWIAMDRATTENGCLWVLPGSHKPGILWPQRQHNDRRFDCAGEAIHFPYREEDAVPVEVEAGAVVFFHGYLLHRSLPNKAAHGYRRALVHHYMSAESFLPWHPPKEGEHMAIADYRDIVMVAGQDPYLWKSTEEIAKPHVRPSGEGGCEKWGRKKHQPGRATA